MPVPYTVSGFYMLPTVKNHKGTKRIADDVKKDFMGTDFADGRGCYIFAVRKGRGAIVPHYVGKTKRSFSGECFTPHKLDKYNAVLHTEVRAAPLLFFLEPIVMKGPFNATALSALEDYLIGIGFQRNQNLKNIHGKKNFDPPFAIRGVHTKQKGNPPEKLTLFRRMLGIK